MPSGITADYSADFFAALNAESSSSGGTTAYELDRGNEEIVATVTTTIESRYNGSGAYGGILGSPLDKVRNFRFDKSRESLK